MNKIIKTGTKVIASIEAESIVNVFVYARGLKRSPSCPVRAKTGKKETTIIRSEKKTGFPTFLTLSFIILFLSSSVISFF